jgi:hypothetical protein
MGTLTSAQRRRLAKEARKLAMECLTNGPEMSDHWCGCAIGTSLKRAGLWRGGDATWRSIELARSLELGFSELEGIDVEMPGTRGILSLATRARRRDNPTAVVIPLLAWADELEAQ